MIDKAGDVYGITSEGGSMGCEGKLGSGTIFELAPDGTETILYSFGGGSDGAYPTDGLMFDAAGNLYGTTYGGGSAGLGTVFKFATDNKETILYSFQCGSDR